MTCRKLYIYYKSHRSYNIYKHDRIRDDQHKQNVKKRDLGNDHQRDTKQNQHDIQNDVRKQTLDMFLKSYFRIPLIKKIRRHIAQRPITTAIALHIIRASRAVGVDFWANIITMNTKKHGRTSRSVKVHNSHHLYTGYNHSERNSVIKGVAISKPILQGFGEPIIGYIISIATIRTVNPIDTLIIGVLQYQDTNDTQVHRF